MGRRALRRIDPSLDLSCHFFELDDLPSEFAPADLFEQDLPLEVEVGSGKGLFLSTAAEQTRSANFLGLEVARKYARFAAARLAKADLENARMICGDALAFFRERLASNAVRAVHVYFPDPWWKKRHKKRRVMTPEFLHDVERVTQPGGSLHFWSDVREYFDTTLEMVAAETSFGAPLDVPERPAEHQLDYRTHFERRMRLDGLPVYRAEFKLAVSD